MAGVENLDELLEKEKRFNYYTKTNVFIFILSSLLVTFVTGYIYWSIFDLNLQEYGWLYLLVVITSSVLMFLAYVNTTKRRVFILEKEKRPLLNDPKKRKFLKEEFQPVLLSITLRKAVSYALFTCNIMFFALFSFLALYVLRYVYLPIAFVLSSVLTSIAIWQVSSS